MRRMKKKKEIPNDCSSIERVVVINGNVVGTHLNDSPENIRQILKIYEFFNRI